MAFVRWPIHDAEAYQGWRATLPGVRDGRTRFVGSDIDASAISAATENTVRAGVTDRVELHTEDMAERFDRLESGAALVSNTPYGKRLGGGRELRRAFNRFGDGLRRRTDIEHVTMVVGDRGFEKATGCRWREVVAFSNQGIPVRVLKLIR
jgi:23S rRNA G2445 N2-methylase RlmL